MLPFLPCAQGWHAAPAAQRKQHQPQHQHQHHMVLFPPALPMAAGPSPLACRAAVAALDAPLLADPGSAPSRQARQLASAVARGKQELQHVLERAMSLPAQVRACEWYGRPPTGRRALQRPQRPARTHTRRRTWSTRQHC